MKRRDFVLTFGSVAAASFIGQSTARAQQSERIRHVCVAVVPNENQIEGPGRNYRAAFYKRLAELGWVDGKNIRVDFRYGAGSTDRAEAIAREFVSLAPDVIFAQGTPATAALKKATKTIPVVFSTVVDPVSAGFVESLSRPGGNITGFSTFEPEIGGKWLEFLKEISPGIRRVAGIVDLPFAAFTKLWRASEATAPAMGLETATINFHQRSDDLESAIASFAQGGNGALVVLPTGINSVDRSRIFALATRHRLPAVYPFTHYATGGGLMAYGLDNIGNFTSGVDYVDRVLRGANPADLPVQAPVKYELVVNLRAAKAIGLSVPPTLLARADEVIE